MGAIKSREDNPLLTVDRQFQLVYIGTMKIRMNVYIEDSQKKYLDALSAKTGAPVAELIRRFIDAGLKKAA